MNEYGKKIAKLYPKNEPSPLMKLLSGNPPAIEKVDGFEWWQDFLSPYDGYVGQAYEDAIVCKCGKVSLFPGESIHIDDLRHFEECQ